MKIGRLKLKPKMNDKEYIKKLEKRIHNQRFRLRWYEETWQTWCRYYATRTMFEYRKRTRKAYTSGRNKMKPIIRIKSSDQLPPKGVPVIVAGGIAMMKTGNEWFTGMEEPLFSRQLEWVPVWWAHIPKDNDE